ncbi:MAG: acylphosphatase [Candidatus Acidiferrales bacterium]
MAVRDTNEARRYYITGMVQGVGYRYFARRVAQRLGVAGYVKNLRDGRVEVYAVGPSAVLAALRAELERGPHSASVSNVAEQDAQVEAGYAEGFVVERDAW